MILGSVSGIIVAASLDLIARYLTATHPALRVAIAGIIGYLAFIGLDTLSTKVKCK